MKEVKIEGETDKYTEYNEEFSFFKTNKFFELLIKLFIDLKYILLIFALLFFLSIPSFDWFNNEILDLTPFIKYITDCKINKHYNRDKIYNSHPFISICISAYNMQDYIEKNILSIINQSFQDFEIIVVNDASEDQTENIINRIQLYDKRIKLLSHTIKFGVYRSRMEAISNSKSDYILLMDPDDMYLNENLLKELYNYNLKYNLDITEFLVLQQNEGSDTIYYPKLQYGNHFHNFDKNIIYQPDLSNILYYKPLTKEYSRTICRNIWNKMIRKEIFIKTNNYIGKQYYNEYIIVADDMLLNIVTYQFAKNYSNIYLPGYLYIQRNNSMSRGGGNELKEIRAINYLLYFKMFYKYIQDYRKDANILFYEMKNLENKLLIIKENNMTKYIPKILNLINRISQESNISNEFKTYLSNLSIFFNNISNILAKNTNSFI